MLAVSWDTVRLFLHVLAATVWVGGQITLAALVPVLRRLGAEIPRAAARRFNQVAWLAFAVLIVTGVWNVIAVRSQITGSYETTLVIKLAMVAVSGVTAALHARARSTAGLAVFGRDRAAAYDGIRQRAERMPRPGPFRPGGWPGSVMRRARWRGRRLPYESGRAGPAS